jgi:pimeloyl-ACP methyl ester carboxylesterase
LVGAAPSRTQSEAISMLRGKLLALALLAGMLLAACGGGHASPGKPTGGAATAPDVPPASFYELPGRLPPGRPGALIRAQAIAGSPQLLGSRAWVAPWPALLERNTPGHAATRVPLLLAQGTNDERVAPASNRSMAARLCRAGDRVELRAYPNVDHLGIIDAAGGDVLAWIGARLAGRPARSTCQP